MKRSSLPFLLAALIAVILGFSNQHDPSLAPEVFEAQFRVAVRSAGFAVIAEIPASPDAVRLPLTIVWHPRRWHTPSAPRMLAGDADSVDHFSLSRGAGSKVECYVKYLEGRAQLVEVRETGRATIDSADLRVVLRQQFPGFPVTLRIE